MLPVNDGSVRFTGVKLKYILSILLSPLLSEYIIYDVTIDKKNCYCSQNLESIFMSSH